MSSRRSFLGAATAGIASVFGGLPAGAPRSSRAQTGAGTRPLVVSTWEHGIPANEAAWKVLSTNGWALDAVEQGVRVPEADPTVTSVGYGGWPDRDGIVTLDASIMDEHGNCGSVAALEQIMHPVSVARLVMERTPHVMLVGSGALQFALENGFTKEDLLTEASKREWQQWLKKSGYTPRTADAEHHDTIGMLAIDMAGNISGAVSTSGLAWKLHGRVGDSPIIGAGLFVDNEVGAACATGIGEAAMKICGSHFVVERMRAGCEPSIACQDAIELLDRKFPQYRNEVICFLALNTLGQCGAFAMKDGFQYAERSNAMKESVLWKPQHLH